jgi:hypothetical protein
VEYRFGRNFDSDFRLLGAAVRRKPTDELSLEYELSRLWLDPDPENASTYIHVLRGVYNFTPDLFIRVFFQTNTAIERTNVQAVFVWRYKPPFGTVQLAYERGTAAFGERSEQRGTRSLQNSFTFSDWHRAGWSRKAFPSPSKRFPRGHARVFGYGG